MKKIIILYFFLGIPFSLFAQEKHSIDSLFSILNTEIKDTLRVNILNELSILYFNIDTDSTIYFAKKANRIAKNKNYSKGEALSFSSLGKVYAYNSNYDSALLFLNKSLLIYEKNKKTDDIIKLKTRKALVFMMQLKYDLALNSFLKALDLAEETNNLEKKRALINNLSVLYYNIEEFNKSYKYAKEALKISIEINDLVGEATAYTNIALYYNKSKEYRKALDFHKKALLIFIQLNRNEEIAQVYLAIGETYYILKKYKRAIDNSLVALKHLENIGKLELRSVLYQNIGRYNIKLGNYKDARISLLKVLELEKQNNFEGEKQDTYLYLSKLDSVQGKYKEALFYFQKYEHVKDSISKLQKEKRVSEIHLKYETQKKDAEFSLLEEKQKLDKARIQKQHLLNIFLTILSLFFIVFFGIIIYVYSKTKKNNTILNYKNSIIENTNIKLENQKHEIKAQKDNLQWHVEKLVEHEESRTASIKYALKIQIAVLPDRFLMDTLFQEYFIFLKPLQIVSGDFYWLKKIENNFIFAVADCTGHGVPAAFLSMLGISTLSETVNKYESLKASDILERLRASLKKTLIQTLDKKTSEDGMDIALCVYNTDTKILQFSGAFRPLYYITQNSNLEKIQKFKESKNFQRSTTESHTLLEIKPDKQPIGTYLREKPFTNHEIEMQKGDSIFLFSDGFSDQFSEKEDKKFTSRRFKELLLSIQKMSMPSQKKMIKKTFSEWIGNTQQTDDILIGGVRF